MSTIARITTAIPKVSVANPAENLEEIQLLLHSLPHAGSDIIVLPRWVFTSPDCGSLLHNGALVKAASEAAEALLTSTKDNASYLVTGMLIELQGEIISAVAVLHKGQVVGAFPTTEDGSGVFDESNLFSCGSLHFAVLTGSLATLPQQATMAAQTGCDLLILASYEPIYTGQIALYNETIRALSRSLGIGIAVVNGGIGGSSFPYIYRGFSFIYECGELLAQMQPDTQSQAITADFDLEILRSQKGYHTITTPAYEIPLVFPKPDLLRPLRKNPFLPVEGKNEYLLELFAYQTHSLALRMENTGLRKFILGISGGLDSTMALLVALAACQKLDLPLTHIIGITQPGMGTSDRTYFNALALMEAAGITYRDISIRPGARQQLEDISHGGEHDTTYENVQARERSQMLFNIANMEGGLVVGSGDLSEEALGFSTFGGDHLSNYNVNACLPKTVMRALLGHIVEINLFSDLSEYITEALETPVSPELLPPDSQGDIQQKTEDILGPYALHDFFLYYFVKYNMRPSKLYHYACIAFADSLSASFIKEKLALFIKRFCAAQFKRSCAPDAASITEVNLLNINYQIPSDLDPSVLLADID